MRYEKILNLLIRNLINFIVFIIPAAFWQPSLDPFGPPQLMAGRVFIPLLLALVIIKGYINGRVVLKKSPLIIPLTGYVLVMLISVFVSINKPVSLKYLTELILFIYGGYLIYSVIDRKDLSRIIFIMIFSQTLVAFYGITQHFGADMFKWNTNFAGRPMGTIGNPDFFAGQMLIPFFMLLAYTVFTKKHRVLALIALVINLACFIFTKVIGAYFGFAAGLAVFAAGCAVYKADILKSFFRKYAKIIIAVSAVCVISAVLLFPAAKSGFASLYKEKKRSLVHRLLMWEASLLMVKDSPLIGKGIGSYRLNYPYYQGILLNDPKNSEYDYVVTWMPHQNYLLIAAETGIAGLGMFLLAIVLFFILCLDIFIKKKRFEPVLFGIMCGVTALLAASFFNTFYNVAATTLYFFFFLFVPYMFTDGSGAFPVKKQYLVFLLAASALLLFYMINGDARTMASNVYLKKANKFEKNNMLKQAIDYYERIYTLKPVELCPQTDVAQFYYGAEAYRKAGYLEKAEENYIKDLKLNPYCPEVNNMLGAVSGQLGKLEDSIKYLETAIFVAPHYEAAFTNLATAYMAKKDYKNAENTLRKYIRVNGTSGKLEAMIDAIKKAEAAR